MYKDGVDIPKIVLIALLWQEEGGQVDPTATHPCISHFSNFGMDVIGAGASSLEVGGGEATWGMHECNEGGAHFKLLVLGS